MSNLVATMVPGEITFFDANGNPLAGGTVNFYQQGTSTPKNTWQDFQGNTLNANPVVLDSAGRANIWGNGLYRQLVKDSLGNTIWDQNVFAGDASSVLDTLGSTQGSVLYRGASLWATLGPSTSGFALTTSGSNANPVWGFPTGAYIAQQIFLTPGTATYTPTSGANSAMVLVVGGGGGGGGAAATSSSQNSVGQSGGGGGWAIKRVTGVTSQTVTVGAAGTAGGNGGTGGTSSFGAIVSAIGGQGGVVGSVTGVPTIIAGVGGGSGSGGDVNGLGVGTSPTILVAAGVASSALGGGSYFGGGGVGAATATSIAGNPGLTFGTGGSGAANAQSQAGTPAGGAGFKGIVIVWEYA